MPRKGLPVALLLILSFAALAQTPSPAAAQPYQDRVIEGLQPDAAEAPAESAFNTSGLPRGYSLELLGDVRRSQDLLTRSLGLKASGYLDTQNYGSLSANLTLQGDGNTLGAPTSYVLRQFGMPFDGGWRADNALGMINLPTLELARKSPRITLTGPAMLGLTSHWLQSGERGVLLGVGRSGRFEGFPVPRFTVAQGTYSLLGLQDQSRASDSLWQWGGMLAQASNVNSPLAVATSGQAAGQVGEQFKSQGELSAQGLYLSARRDSLAMGSFWQINATLGTATGADLPGQSSPRANGLWLDGGFNSGLHRHGWGVFRLEPGLAWLDLALPSDLQGGYWRYARRTRQWSMESELDGLTSISGTTPNGFFASNSLRYQYSSSTSFGGSFNLRRYGYQAQSLLLYTQFANDWGSSRAQIEWGSADTGDRLTRFQFDHDWTFVQALRLSTTVSLDTEQKQNVQTQGRGVAVNADWALGQNITATHSLQGRWTSDQTQYNLNFGLNWRFAPQWSLQTSAYAVQGTSNTLTFAQSPLAPIATVMPTVNDSGLFITLRYDASAGRANAPLGGVPGGAAGRLTGSVYLDENKNAKRDAGERGAAGVTVLLNGRFATQTDAQGRFEFPYVTAGAHVLTVSSDNLPLPWSLENEGRTGLRVFTRDTTTLDIGAVRF